MATAWPWVMVKPLSFSMAWPRVWPKLRSLRFPRSNSSSPTTEALISTFRRTTPLMSVSMRPAMRLLKKSRSAMRPCLTVSATPSAKVSGGRVRKVSVSQRTSFGWWKAPTRFFPASRSTAVLPPTEESEAARKVVGIWI